jgi:hypothetical protein
LFNRSAATACKNPLRLAKNDHFFVSDATAQTVPMICLHFNYVFSSLRTYTFGFRLTARTTLFTNSNWLGGTLSGPKRPIFRPTSQIFVGRSEATAYKNPLRLAKNGLFFVSDATTLTSYYKQI